MDQIKTQLREKGIKPTYIRIRVLEYLLKNRDHPTAEMVYEYLKKEIPTISKTSVYNALHLFLKKGVVNPVVITGTDTRFDINLTPHHHFLCKKCGRIIDIDIVCEYYKKGEIAGNIIEELHGYFKGRCRECVRKEN